MKIKKRIKKLIAQHYIEKARRRKKTKSTIKVGFLVQVPQLWDKQEPLYRLMRSSHNFEPWLIILPEYDYTLGNFCEYGDELSFFTDVCKKICYIKARKDDGWENLSDYEFDYIFFQRPYDYYLPQQYNSENIIRYTKICYIPYATPDRNDNIIYPEEFFRNVYLGFMEDKHCSDYNNKLYSRKSFQRFHNIGYPPFERCLQLQSNAFNGKILWTPRWSYDHVYGGSHFFEYNVRLTNFDWGRYRFIVRPHPMMWSNFIKEKLIDKETINHIKEEWNSKSIIIDTNIQIEDTFNEVDILISDKSSVILLFFLTGKPIVYCRFGNDNSVLFDTILPGLYVVDDWEGLNKTISNLMNNIDPLKEIRNRIISQSFSHHKEATKSIMSMIETDFYNV